MTQHPELASEIQSLINGLTQARHDIKQGKLLDLTPMHPRLTALCATIDGLPGGEAADYKKKLVGVMDELDLLTKTVKQGLKDLEGQIGEASRRGQAHLAYSKPKG
ncbi:MAG: hypothetical protein AAF530_05295 [Pseudomonadota bacterium]